LLQHAELHGGTLVKKIASDFSVALLRYQNNRTCDQDQNYFINIKKQCQRIIQLQNISNEVREIFQHNLEYIEEQIRNSRVKSQKQTILSYDEDIFESCD
jgi:predicted HD phosphohydrolase